MGCGGSKQGGVQRPGGDINLARGGKPGKLTVWGDYLNCDTRTVLAMLKHKSIEHNFQLVDTLKDEHKQESYVAQSYCETIPMLSNDIFKVIGGDITTIKYLKNAYPEIKEELYPKDLEANVDKFLGWYQSKMRPGTQRLIRMLVLPKVISTNAVKHEDKVEEFDLIFGSGGLIEVIEKTLEKTKAFIAGDRVTIADFAIYSEILTVMMLTEQDSESLSSRNYHETARWFGKLSEFPCFAEVNKSL